MNVTTTTVPPRADWRAEVERATAIRPAAARRRGATEEPPWVRRLLIGAALAFLTLFLFVPLATVFHEALKKGWEVYVASVVEPDALAAIRLTLLAAAIAVPLNLVFGIAAAWCIAKFDFRGRQLLLTLIDLPFSVSPVIAGLIYVLVFGLQGWFGETLRDHDLKVIFAVPGIVLATTFVPVGVSRQCSPLTAAFRLLTHPDRCGSDNSSL